MAARNRSRGPGRPAGDRDQAVRRGLLDAARALCIEVGLDAASTKAIAARAGVNPAMINYYFGGKEALGQAMMRDAMAPILAEIERAGAQLAKPRLEDFVRGYMRALARNSWLPQLVVREVLPANGRFRALFLSELASRAAKLLPTLIRAEQAAGRFDPSLDAREILISLVSLAVFPFVGAPVLEPALGLNVGDEERVEGLIEHTLAFLKRGFGPADPG